jgi:hypothetical protein
MRTKLLFIGLSTFMTLLSAHANPQEVVAIWRGTLAANGVELRLEARIGHAGDAFNGELISLDQGNVKLVLADIRSSDVELAFTIPQIAARFSGHLTSNGTAANGEYVQGGARLPLTLTQFDSIGAAIAETLREAWFGKLNMGAVQPLVQFRIVDFPNGETKVYFDSITEGRTGFVGSWCQEGNELAFDIPAISLRFTGALSEDGTIARGIWRQGDRDVPLTLNRSVTEYRNTKVWDNRPQRPQPPFPYDVEEVRFDN